MGAEKLHEILREVLVCRHGVLCHEKKEIRIRAELRSQRPRSAVVKILCLHRNSCNTVCNSLCIKVWAENACSVLFQGIHEKDSVHGRFLLSEKPYRLRKFFIRMINRDNHADIHTVIILDLPTGGYKGTMDPSGF